MPTAELLVKSIRELDNHAMKVLCIDAALYWTIKHFKSKATVNEKLDTELLVLKSYLSKEISDYNSYSISQGPNHLFSDGKQNLNVMILSDYFSGNARALKDIDTQFLEDIMEKLKSLIFNIKKSYNIMIDKINLVMPISEKKREAIEIYMRALRRSGQNPSLQRLADFAQPHITKAYWKQYLQSIPFLTLLMQNIVKEKEKTKDERLLNLYSIIEKELSQTIEKKWVSHYLYLKANLLIDCTDDDEKNILSMINTDQSSIKHKFNSKDVISQVLNAKSPIMNSDVFMRVDDMFHISDAPHRQFLSNAMSQLKKEDKKLQKKKDKKLLKKINKKLNKTEQKATNGESTQTSKSKTDERILSLKSKEIIIDLFDTLITSHIKYYDLEELKSLIDIHFKFKNDNIRLHKEYSTEDLIVWMNKGRVLIHFIQELIKRNFIEFTLDRYHILIEKHFYDWNKSDIYHSDQVKENGNRLQEGRDKRKEDGKKEPKYYREIDDILNMYLKKDFKLS